MAAAPDDYDWFENRIAGTRVNQETAEKYRRWVERFETWRPAAEPTTKHLMQFDSVLSDEEWTDYPWENATGRPAPATYSYSSRTIALSAVKLWVRLQYSVTIDDEVQNLVYGEPEPFDPEYLSMGDVRDLIRNAEDDCNCSGCKAALALSYDAILRAAELTNVRVEDVDLDAGTLYTRPVKGSVQATLSLTTRTVSLLREYIREEDPVTKMFTNTYGNGWKKTSWSSHIRRNHHEVGSHSIGRHSPIVHRLQHPEEFADIDKEAGVFGQVYRRARHQNPSMTVRYARLVGVTAPDWAE